MTIKECKMSKQGWPLGVYSHNLGMCYSQSFDALAKQIKAKYDLIATKSIYDTDPRYTDVVITARLSMEKYGQIRAYVDGFRAGQIC